MGPKSTKSCTVQPGDELCWDYGKEYWANWTSRIAGKREQRGGGGTGGAGGKRTHAGGPMVARGLGWWITWWHAGVPGHFMPKTILFVSRELTRI